MEPPTKRSRQDSDEDVSTAVSPVQPLPYHDVNLQGYSNLCLRIFILPNAWICTKIDKDDSDLLKKTTFSFPRISRILHDSSVLYEITEWNGKDMVGYDTLSIAMVLAELAGDETALRNLKEIDILGRDNRVVTLLNK